jgi:hypothetical protein
MISRKKIFLPLCFLLAAFTGYAQVNQEYVFNDIGWKITIPLDFTLYDFIDEARTMQEPSAYTDEFDNTQDVFFSQTNILAIKDRFNYFNITTNPFDPAEDGSWETAVQSWKNEAYNSKVKMFDSAKLDTASSIKYIDGIAFNKFHITVSLDDEIKLELFLLNKLYKGYEFNISYLNLDGEARKQIELMLLGSTFNKNN